MTPIRRSLALLPILALGPTLLTGMCLLSVPVAAQTPTAQTPAAQVPVAPAVPVSVVKPIRRDIPVILRGLGTAAAYNSVLVRSRVDGTLDRVAFIEGQDVKAGDLLAQLDPRPYQAALDQALAKRAADEASLTSAQQDLRRATTLAVRQFEAQQVVDQRAAVVLSLEASIKGDDAAIAAARLNLDFTHITSPIDGRVGLRLIDPGNFIRAADPSLQGIVTVSQVHPISVTFTLPQDQLQTVTAAMAHEKPKVLAYASDDVTLLGTGEVLTIDNAIDSTTGTIKVKATFQNPDNKLWPGQFVNARVVVDVKRGALTVPSAAIQRGPSGLYVYVAMPDQTVSVRPVEVSLDTGSIAVVDKGLDGNEAVVLTGQSRLSINARVTATDAPAS